MKELYTLIHILRLKSIDFTRAIHQQISPNYIAWRGKTRLDFIKMEGECKKVLEAISQLGLTIGDTDKLIRMFNGAAVDYYQEYIEGLRLEYNRYYECVNSPLWR